MDRGKDGNAGGAAQTRTETWRDWLGRDWFHAAHQALLADFDVEPAEKKLFVDFLFDAGFYDRATLTPAGGMQRFRDCLHPARTAKFRLTEVLALARQFDRREFLSFALAQVGGPQVGDHIEIQRLAEQVAALTAEVAALRDSRRHRDIDHRMHPAVHDAGPGRPLFSLPEDELRVEHLGRPPFNADELAL